jgi:hypothetical protein
MRIDRREIVAHIEAYIRKFGGEFSKWCVETARARGFKIADSRFQMQKKDIREKRGEKRGQTKSYTGFYVVQAQAGLVPALRVAVGDLSGHPRGVPLRFRCLAQIDKICQRALLWHGRVAPCQP